MNSAVFVDFENLFTSLQERAERVVQRPRDAALQILEQLKARLQADGLPMVLGRSYAAFDTYPGMEVAHDLALMGFDPQYVLAAPSGRSSASVQIAVDVCRVLFRRPDIESFVVVAGAGDFIPIARQVLEENRGLRVVALPDATSGDLRLRVGAERFVDALSLLPMEPNARPAADDAPATGASTAATSLPIGGGERAVERPTERPSGRAGAAIVGHIPVTWSGKVAPGQDGQDQLAQCLDLLVRARIRHGSPEIWLSPFLKGPLTQAFGGMVHPQRRALINELRDCGAIRVEVRENQFADHPYSVIVLNDQHPLVAAALERSQRS